MDGRMISALSISYLNGVGRSSETRSTEPFLPITAAVAKAVETEIRSYSFDGFTNWGLTPGSRSTRSGQFNWRLTYLSEPARCEVIRRIRLLQTDDVFSTLRSKIRERYSAEIVSAHVFGGYLYSREHNFADVDIIICIDVAGVIETALAIELKINDPCSSDEVTNIVHCDLTVVSQGQINNVISSATVIRTAVIAASTAFTLFGNDLVDGAVPIPVLVYHAKELLSTGFRSLIDPKKDLQSKVINRLIESNQVLQFIDAQLGVLPDPNRAVVSELILNEWTKSTHTYEVAFDQFMNTVCRMRDRFATIQGKICEQALILLKHDRDIATQDCSRPDSDLI